MATCQRAIELCVSNLGTVQQFQELLKNNGIPVTGYVNWYACRWPSISMMGGMAMGNISNDLEFFYDKPFAWQTAILDCVMTGGGRKYGVRIRYRGVGGPLDIDCLPPEGQTDVYKRYDSPGVVKGGRSYLFTLTAYEMAQSGCFPSYILANGRRIWDAKLHPRLDGRIMAPFWHEKDGDIIIDLVVDLSHAPRSKGLAFRHGHCQFLGLPGTKISLAGAAGRKEGSPLAGLERFRFGLFPGGYDFWTKKGPRFDDIRRNWKPNFRPDYPVDDVYLSPVIFWWPGRGGFHDFMATYGGCNMVGQGADHAFAGKLPHLRAALARDVEEATRVLALGDDVQAHWMRGERGILVAHRGYAENDQTMAAKASAIAADKKATGHPDRCRHVYESFPPALSHARQYECGTDVLMFKNEEDPQYNILMSMCRGAGRTYGKPFGFYWEQTHYPYPSMDFKLHACMLYFLSGGSWISAEAEETRSFNEGYVSDWVYPYIQAQRFAMVHPARGQFVSSIGVLYGKQDRWWVPYNPLGHVDTFQRHLRYDHATRTVTSEPSFTKPLPFVPKDRAKWNFLTAGHLPYFFDQVDEMKGYDLLDVFFPRYGDAFTARTTRLLTGTPCGPLDFVYGPKAPVELLQSYGVLAALGQLNLDAGTERRLLAAARKGTCVLVGAQHFTDAGGKSRKVFGLTLGQEPHKVQGKLGGDAGIYGRARLGAICEDVFEAASGGAGWRTVTSVAGRPLVVSRQVGKGEVFVYLGRWIHRGAKALRPILARMGQRAALLEFSPAADHLEYVAYRKGSGAWAAVFNHGNIVIGCDRLKKPRAQPPEPLASTPGGPYHGNISFRLDRLGLDVRKEWRLYEVEGIDGEAFDAVISGHAKFAVRQVECRWNDNSLQAAVQIVKRAQYVIAPPGMGDEVFFGPASVSGRMGD